MWGQRWVFSISWMIKLCCKLNSGWCNRSLKLPHFSCCCSGNQSLRPLLLRNRQCRIAYISAVLIIFSPAAAENICPVMIVQVVALSDKVWGKGSSLPISNTSERDKEVQPGEELLSCTDECYNVGLWICHHYWEEEEKLVLASVEQGKHCVWWDAAAGGNQEQRLNKTWEMLCCAGCCTQSSVCYMRRELCPPTASIEGTPGPGFCPAEQWPSGIYPCGVSLLCSVALRHRGTSHCISKAFFKVGFTDILSQMWVTVSGYYIKTAHFFF